MTAPKLFSLTLICSTNSITHFSVSKISINSINVSIYFSASREWKLHEFPSLRTQNNNKREKEYSSLQKDF